MTEKVKEAKGRNRSKEYYISKAGLTSEIGTVGGEATSEWL